MPSIDFKRPPIGGVTVAEMLVVLAALALISAVLASGVRPPSDRLDLEQEEAELAASLAQLRFQAVETSEMIVVEDFAEVCSGGAGSLTLFPDGTAIGGPFCLTNAGTTKILQLDPLTARFLSEDSE